MEIINGEPRHSYNPFDNERVFKSMQDVVGAYVKITYTDGRPPRYHFMNNANIAKRRNKAQTSKVWDEWVYEMARKTVLIDVFNRRLVPVDPLVERQITAAIESHDAELGVREPAPVAAVGNLEDLKVTMRDAGREPNPAEGEVIDAEPMPAKHPGTDLPHQRSPESPPEPSGEAIPKEEPSIPGLSLDEQLDLFKAKLPTLRTMKAVKQEAAILTDQTENPDDLDYIAQLAEERIEQIRAARAKSEKPHVEPEREVAQTGPVGELFDSPSEPPF